MEDLVTEGHSSHNELNIGMQYASLSGTKKGLSKATNQQKEAMKWEDKNQFNQKMREYGGKIEYQLDIKPKR